jgi:triacylglycerol lipase
LATVASLLMVLAVVGTSCTPASRPLRLVSAQSVSEPSGKHPVLIVPGWALECRHGPPSEWNPWTRELAAAGWHAGEVEVLDYDTCASAVETAELVGDAVQKLRVRTGANRVSIIAHSMGAISARWCIAFGSCAGKVAQVVTLAGANHGTFWAQFCGLQFWSKGCGDLRADSDALAKLNAGDETPDDSIAWQTWVSICELVIVPRQSAALAGAEVHDVTDRCVYHDDWKRDMPTIRAVVVDLAAV